MSKEFIGAIGERACYFMAIRNAFKDNTFDLSSIHRLPKFSYTEFAEWAKDLNRQRIDDETKLRLQFYVVNYLLCPECEDVYEVEALVREIFSQTGEFVIRKTIFKIGKYELVKTR